MITIFILIISLSITLLLTIKHLQIRFAKIEILILSLFLSFICQHINFKIFSAYERLSVQEAFIPRVISYLHFGVVFPLLLFWVLYLFRSKAPTPYKLFYALLWLGFDLFSKQMYLIVNVLESNTVSWYPLTDLGISTTTLILAIVFMHKLRAIVKKEGVAIE